MLEVKTSQDILGLGGEVIVVEDGDFREGLWILRLGWQEGWAFWRFIERVWNYITSAFAVRV